MKHTTHKKEDMDIELDKVWYSENGYPREDMPALYEDIKDFIRKSRQQLIDEVVGEMPKKMEKSDNHSFNMGGFGQRVEGYNQAIDDIITLLNTIKNSTKST